MASRALQWVVLAALLNLGLSRTSSSTGSSTNGTSTSSSTDGTSIGFLMNGTSIGSLMNETSTGSSTNGTIPKPECNGSVEVGFRYANNSVGVRDTTEPLHIVAANTGERGGCITATEIWEAFGFFSPLYPVDPDSGAFSAEITGTWMLEEDVIVQDGVTLQVWGPDSGGDVTELRLKSTPATDDADATVVNLRAYGGSLDFENTKVVGWNTMNNTFATDTSDGRSYISAIAAVTDESACDLAEARMDIVNSEMAYMGYRDPRGGLTWQAESVCSNGSASVYGNIYNSELHHMFTAVYMIGHQQADVRGNVLYNNERSGIYAADNSNSLTIHDNSFQFSDVTGSTRAIRVSGSSNSSIQNNIINGGYALTHGIEVASGSDFAVVKDNLVYDIVSNGVDHESSKNSDISNNVFDGARNGVLLTGDSDDNLVYNNAFYNISVFGLVSRFSTSGRPDDNVFDSNTIGEGAIPFQFDGVDGVHVINNEFIDPARPSDCSNSTNVVFTGNVGLVQDITLNVVGVFDMR